MRLARTKFLHFYFYSAKSSLRRIVEKGNQILYRMFRSSNIMEQTDIKMTMNIKFLTRFVATLKAKQKVCISSALYLCHFHCLR